MNVTSSTHRGWLVGALLSLSLILWLHGLLSSQIYKPAVHIPKRKAAALLRDAAAHHTEDLQLAKAYWLRYTDVRTHPFFGEDGPLGITGAIEHYRQHGRREGRIFELKWKIPNRNGSLPKSIGAVTPISPPARFGEGPVRLAFGVHAIITVI